MAAAFPSCGAQIKSERPGHAFPEHPIEITPSPHFINTSEPSFGALVNVINNFVWSFLCLFIM